MAVSAAAKKLPELSKLSQKEVFTIQNRQPVLSDEFQYPNQSNTDFRRLRRLDVGGAVRRLRDVDQPALEETHLLLRKRRLHQTLPQTSSRTY